MGAETGPWEQMPGTQTGCSQSLAQEPQAQCRGVGRTGLPSVALEDSNSGKLVGEGLGMVSPGPAATLTSPC